MLASRCLIVMHDFTYFATREMGRLYETEKYLHNYALTYALGLAKSAYFNPEQVPKYATQLTPLNNEDIYVTPARPVVHEFMFHTFKMASVPYYSFTPQTTVNKVLFGRAKELAPGSAFEFYVISRRRLHLPRWIRLGKWMSKARVEVLEEVEGEAKERGAFTAACVLNPLDVGGQLQAFDIISMPPVSLVVNARIDGPYYELLGGAKIPAGMKYTFPD